MKVKDVMLKKGKFPILTPKTLLKEALVEMVKTKLGLVCITDLNNKLIGIFTDGDIRRMLLKNQKPFSAFFVDDIIDHANLDPTTCKDSDSLKESLKLMEEKGIWDLPVLDEENNLIGLFHLHQAISKLI
tara:strand:- start:79524 stop:79913 length:390 start_codon:yes stop_codon:yes gene_type:complete